MAGNIEAKCPVCEFPGSEYEPPIHDVRYRQQMDRIKGDIEQGEGREISSIADDEVHQIWLKKMGGYIATCSNPECMTTFFVRA